MYGIARPASMILLWRKENVRKQTKAAVGNPFCFPFVMLLFFQVIHTIPVEVHLPFHCSPSAKIPLLVVDVNLLLNK